MREARVKQSDPRREACAPQSAVPALVEATATPSHSLSPNDTPRPELTQSLWEPGELSLRCPKDTKSLGDGEVVVGGT